MIKLYAYDYEEEYGVATLFDKDDCSGRSGALLSGAKGTVTGFTKSELYYQNNMYYTTPSAVQLPPGYTLEVFGSDHFAHSNYGL